MAVSRALRRLLRVLNIEEEQARLALESAVGDLGQLERALTATRARARSGRRLVNVSAQTGDLPDRLAGLEETSAAKRFAEVLTPRIADAESQVDSLRQAFLAKRVESRQAETLIEEAEARDAIVASRRSQQGLDDWYLNRLHTRRLHDSSSEPTDVPAASAPTPRNT